MNMTIKKIFAVMMLILSMGLVSCNSDKDTPSFPDKTTYNMTGFARGADVSWLTEMEKSGKKFYNADGKEMDCLTLLRDLGVNSVRLRVWVNPTDGWCGKQDVLAKALRAKALGFRIMIDFHYSDTWTDPGSQMKPAAWKSLSFEGLKEAIADHTKDVLNALKADGITPEWIQIGNEVTSGLLWDTDTSTSGATWDAVKDGVTYKANESNFAAFLNAGSAAARGVFPKAKIVIHLDGGANANRTKWIGDILQKYAVDYDVLGLSLYPDSDWSGEVTSCIENMKDIKQNYGKDVMICEVGMPEDDPATAKACLTSLMSQSKALSYCLGVFYWEPECYGGWENYGLGAFNDNGQPTAAMDAFATK